MFIFLRNVILPEITFCLSGLMFAFFGFLKNIGEKRIPIREGNLLSDFPLGKDFQKKNCSNDEMERTCFLFILICDNIRRDPGAVGAGAEGGSGGGAQKKNIFSDRDE